MAEYFPNLMIGINILTQGNEQVPNRRNPKKATPRHIITKLIKTKDKKKSLENSQRNMMHYIKGNNNQKGSGLPT